MAFGEGVACGLADLAMMRLLQPQRVDAEHLLGAETSATSWHCPQCNHAGTFPRASKTASKGAISGEVKSGDISKTNGSAGAVVRYLTVFVPVTVV